MSPALGTSPPYAPQTILKTELQTVIEELYVAFGDVPKPLIIEGCPCCIERKKVDVLLTTPLRQIPPDQLTGYATSVFFTVGCTEDFLYLLPRILEISACDPSWWPDPEVVAVKLKMGKFHEWTELHKTTVVRYYNAILDDLLNTEQSGWRIDSWICALGRLFPDVSPFLGSIANYPSKIVEYYEENSECLTKGKLKNTFWDHDSAKAYGQVVDWFNSEHIRSVITAHYRT